MGAAHRHGHPADHHRDRIAPAEFEYMQRPIFRPLIERQRQALTELGERGEIDPATLAKVIGAAYGL